MLTRDNIAKAFSINRSFKSILVFIIASYVHYLNGLHLGDGGLVKIFDTPLQSEGKYHFHIRRLRSQIGFSFQQFNLVDRLSALDNVLIGNLSRVSLSRSLYRQVFLPLLKLPHYIDFQAELNLVWQMRRDLRAKKEM